MISVAHFRATVSAEVDFADRGQRALSALAGRPGFVTGSLGRSTDDIASWVLVTEWENVGSYRRALGSYEVKLAAAPLLGEALDLPTSFESLVQVAADGTVRAQSSDHSGSG